MPAYTGLHRRAPDARHRHRRSNLTMSVVVGLILAVIIGLGVFYAIRHGVINFMNGS